MFRLEAPYPGYQTTTVLPSPDWGNSNNRAGTVQIQRMMNGRVQSYKKDRHGRRKLHWAFTLSREKAIELKAFMQAYYSSVLRIIDSDGDVYLAYLQTVPFELGGGEKASGFPGDETQHVTLEFEEKL